MFGSLRSPFDPRSSSPEWLAQQELAPVDTSTPPRWLYLRNGITPNGFHFKMTLEEYKRIYRGTNDMDRSGIINLYNHLINYFNQLDYTNQTQLKNFLEWKIWWGKSLDLVIPKSDSVYKYNAIEFKDPAYRTFADNSNLKRLASEIYPKPVLYRTPTFIDLSRESRVVPFIPFKPDFDIEGDHAKYARINRTRFPTFASLATPANAYAALSAAAFASAAALAFSARGKYKRTKRHNKFRKYTRKHTKKHNKKHNKKHKNT